MIEYTDFKNIKGTFENLDIYIHSINIERFAAIKNSTNPAHSPYTAILDLVEDLSFYNYGENTNMVGKIFVSMHNQREDENTILYFSFTLNVMAKSETNKANIFAKTVQYLFDIIKEKSESGIITDRAGGKFIVPAFGYSQTDFEKHF